MAVPDLARYYRVLGTPHTVINGAHHVRGRVQEAQLLAAIRASIGSDDA